MSEPGDPNKPYREHFPDYSSLKTEEAQNEAQSPQALAEEVPLSDYEKAMAADEMRAEELRLDAASNKNRHPTDSVNTVRAINAMPYEKLLERKLEREASAEVPKEISDLDRARAAALKRMEDRDIPPAPEEPTRPETRGKPR